MDEYKNNKKIKIPEGFLQKLEEEKLRTGYGALKLFRGRKNIPVGLNSGIINTWLSRSVESARPSHMEYVLQKYAELPSGNLEENEKRFNNYQRRHQHESYVPIDNELIEREMKRSGLTPTDIFLFITDHGSELTFSSLGHIIQKVQSTAHKHDYNLILECLLNAPDYEPPPLKPVKKSKQKLRDGYITLTPSILKKLQFYRSKQLLPHGIFKGIPFAPQNPRPRDVIVWFSGKNASIKKTDWEFIEHHCEAALEAVCPQA